MRSSAILGCVLMAAVLISATPYDISLFYKGYFMEFQKDINNRTTCYYVTQDVYNDVSDIWDRINDFTVRDLPTVVGDATRTMQLFLDHNDVCQAKKMIQEALNAIRNPQLLLSRLDFLSLITIVNNIQQGMMAKNYFQLGRGVGLLVRKALDFQI